MENASDPKKTTNPGHSTLAITKVTNHQGEVVPPGGTLITRQFATFSGTCPPLPKTRMLIFTRLDTGGAYEFPVMANATTWETKANFLNPGSWQHVIKDSDLDEVSPPVTYVWV
ncbi:hypothetical protein BK649_04175 [Pseudomonas canadensis]|uniref:Uncharacterized protein n=1 Tax=Pseudomonas canadensis TaxID=915099 RepID=A0A423FF32_9PSED|nr:hypothetical protein [Pseudomonas canadensis]ROM56165.1 hypothetical protein BK649_04175 [Pseudomonas canadensis]